MNQRILLIEDDRELRAALKEALSVEGYTVQTSASLADARALLQHADRHTAPELVLLDLGLPDGDGETFLAELRRAGGTPVIVIS
ncbi:MAG: response regulator, partial [Hydrogenophaga sp.]|nr:response regulator [Hydrogenophaga sp.]